jgi:hypothetical protein
MKFRKHEWFDKEKYVQKFGIQARHGITGVWHHVAENGEPCLFDKESDRDDKIKEFRKLEREKT